METEVEEEDQEEGVVAEVASLDVALCRPAHSRVKALPSGLLQALAWLCCSGCGFCPRPLFSSCGMVWDFLTLLWSKMTLEVLPAHPVWSPPCDFSLISLCP